VTEEDPEENKEIQTPQQKRQDKKDRSAMKERYSYIILALIMILLAVILGGFMVSYVKNNDRAWCEIIIASLPDKPPPMPTDPTEKGYKDKVKLHDDYFIVVRLGQRFGCLH
jgi:hypothetical protein